MLSQYSHPGNHRSATRPGTRTSSEQRHPDRGKRRHSRGSAHS
jgi:hypothetical protein